ncbi:MAG: UpxY family transcription antiterminator [Candidatus Acidiferrales bacterium]
MPKKLTNQIATPEPIPATPQDSHLPWFALHVRSRFELTVASHLGGKGYECFLPTFKSRRRWSDRVKEIEAPLFPGYLFCRFDVLDRFPIVTTPGLIQIVGFNRAPVPVTESEIAALQQLVSSKLRHEPWPYLKAGARVMIEAGSLTGLEGIYIESKGTHRLVLSVTLLQRSVAVEIDSAYVRVLPESRLASSDVAAKAVHPRV